MPAKPNVDYSPYNASPAGVPETETRGDYLNVQATPNDMGAQIGGALSDAGKEGQNLALEYQGRINEAATANAETQLIQQNAAAKGKFLSTQGLESQDALPEYKQSLIDNYQNLRKDLPLGAVRSFDMVGNRWLANSMGEAETHAAGQIKQANMTNHANLINATAAMASDPDTFTNPAMRGYMLGTIKYAHGAMVDADSPGLTTDENGTVKFDDSTPEGQDAKQSFNAQVDHSTGVLWQNGIAGVANRNPLEAQQLYDDNKQSISPIAQARIESYLTPKVNGYKADGIVNTAVNMGAQEHQSLFTNPSSAGSSPNNLGNVKTPEGARSNTPDFVNYKTPTDGVIGAANNLRNGYQGLTLQEIGTKWTGENPTKAADWVKNVSTVSGLAPDVVPNLNDPAQMSKLLSGISAAEKSPNDRSLFTSDVINQGVQSSLAGKQPDTSDDQPKPPYPTNINGTRMTQADWFSANKDKVLEWGDQMAGRDFPGNHVYQNMVRERLSNQMSAAVSAQSSQYRQDNMYVMQAINGELTQGKAPTTYEDLRAIPNVGPVLDRVAYQDPKFSENIDHMLSRSSKEDGLGSGFSYLQQEAYNGKIGVDDLLYHVGDDLTQSGFTKLREAIKGEPSTDQKSDNQQLATFLKYGHDRILHSSLFHNTPEAEQSYQNWFSSVDSAIKSKQKDGAQLSSLIDPTSKDYVGSNIGQFAIPVQKQLGDRADRINNRLGTAAPLEQTKMRLPGESPEAYWARVK